MQSARRSARAFEAGGAELAMDIDTLHGTLHFSRKSYQKMAGAFAQIIGTNATAIHVRQKSRKTWMLKEQHTRNILSGAMMLPRVVVMWW